MPAEPTSGHRIPVTLVTDIGVRLPAHLTANGRSILAHLSAAQVRALFPSARGFVDRTGQGPATLPELRRVLAGERQRKWAEEIGLVTPGLRSVAACVFDHSGWPCAAISVTWREGHARASHAELVQGVRAGAQQLTAVLSGHGPEGWFDASDV